MKSGSSAVHRLRLGSRRLRRAARRATRSRGPSVMPTARAGMPEDDRELDAVARLVESFIDVAL